MNPSKDIDEKYMRIAIELAEKGKGRTSPNPMVGAVIVKNDEIVGTGYHQRAGTPHAEIHAITEAGEKAKDSTMYVNLEPCSHYGRTPPCTDAIIKAGISKVIIAMTDPNPKVNGKGKAILESQGIKVVTGILEQEARRLNEVFIKYITTGMPFVTIKVAMSIDGKIATFCRRSKWISCDDSRLLVHQIRNEVDAIVIGIGTVLCDNPMLTTRLPNGRDAIRVVLDSRARIPLDSNVLNINAQAKTIVAVTKLATEEKIERLRKYAEVLIIPEKDGRVDIVELMKKLAEMEITNILIEGGAEVNASALKGKIVDRVMFFIAPKIIGGNTAPGPIGGNGVEDPSEAIKLTDISIRQVGEDILVSGKPLYKSDI